MEVSELGGKGSGDATFTPPGLQESIPRIKICGLTRVEEALMCAQLGASAIGCVFYPKSPRNISEERARDICSALPAGICPVGVFVNESFAGIMQRVERCGLKAVQLHGREPPDLVVRLRRTGLIVIKAVFEGGAPAIDSAGLYEASACLVECAGGVLPGGNAMAWDWSAARRMSDSLPFILAGGLNPANVSEAIRAACPDAVDVSSGVETEPGRKDLEKVRRFIEAVRATPTPKRIKGVFRTHHSSPITHHSQQ